MQKWRRPVGQSTVATVSAMREITTPIITITLVMASVFLPVGFLEGSTGVFYRQFAFTLAIAVLISAVNALTLSPALCALFLGDLHQDETKSGAHRFTGFQHRFFTGFNTGFNVLKRRYLDVLVLLLRKRNLSLIGLALITAVAFWMFKSTPTGFIPDEDNGFVIVSVSMPPGASLERTQVTMDRAAGSLRQMEAVNRVISVAGINILSRSSSPSSGLIFMQLKDLHERVPGVTSRMFSVQSTAGFLPSKRAPFLLFPCRLSRDSVPLAAWSLFFRTEAVAALKRSMAFHSSLLAS